MNSSKANQLVDYLDRQAASAPNSMEFLPCQRDALLAVEMWDTCLRGVDCSKLRLQGFFQTDSRAAQIPLYGDNSSWQHSTNLP